VKKLSMIFLGLILVLVTSGMASALPFSNTVDFNQYTYDGVTYDRINDTGNTTPPGSPGYDFAFSYSHTATFNPAAASITDATLTLRHFGNSANSTELWFLWNDSASIISNLSYSAETYTTGPWYNQTTHWVWVTETFTLPSSLFAGVNGSSWTIAFRLDENTSGEDEYFRVDFSTLSGNYTPVPEPVSMLLFGTGLIGIGGYARRRFKK
jgi:hypothetical protein